MAAEYEMGWRAEFCRIEELELHADRMAGRPVEVLVYALQERYHVPVTVNRGG